ncbi:MAG: transcription-repair coupling factor [Clostridiales bacterium]|nr:transcription-repair coupling factor [Clostridiales bacterium]
MDLHRIITAFRQTQEYQEIKEALSPGKAQLLTGLPLLPQAAWLAALFEEKKQPVLLLTAKENEALLFHENLRAFLGEKAGYFPSLELLPFNNYAQNIEVVAGRIRLLSRLLQGEKMVVTAWCGTVSRRLVPPLVFAAGQMSLRVGESYNLNDLTARLIEIGYSREKLVEAPGQFGLRGDLLDIFPITGQRPLRLEFFDDQLERMRYFDLADQRSREDEEDILIAPARELLLDDEAWQKGRQRLSQELEKTGKGLEAIAKRHFRERFTPLLELLEQRVWDESFEKLLPLFYSETAGLLDYFPSKETVYALSEPEEAKAQLESLAKERHNRYYDLLEGGQLLPSFNDNFLNFDDLTSELLKRPLLFFSLLPGRGNIPIGEQWQFLARDLGNYCNNLPALSEDLAYFRRSGYRVIFSASSPLRLQRVEHILKELDYPGVELLEAGFSKGFESSQLKMALISEKDLLGQETKKKKRRFARGGEKIDNFLDLQVGDHVVHLTHGIGRYSGVRRIVVDGTSRDYLTLEYAGEDKLFLPHDQLDMIQKYIGNDSQSPKLYKLGGGEWQRAKNKVRGAVHDMADGLLQLYTAREAAQGYAFTPDSIFQQEFEDAFPYEETPDQLRAAREIKADMEKKKPMDRLLCGDVGYGKTEVALRAAFKAVMDGKQVAVLVPTTVLAQQHYHTFCRRFAGYPVQIGCLSRFGTPKEQKSLLAKLSRGSLDIVIGTHRLLSKDVVFHDLGLLVVDEEQRFGVGHKEKIKTLRQNIDVLTLSATPIPRTLHMALVGMRDMSVIATPPEDRHPVQTYVLEYHERLLADVISREIERGGQVYFVHNRVYNIYQVANLLTQLAPQARLAVAHGQMPERELEQVMLDFINGEFDVLLCTTIIESGLDIPNVNTLIVDEAENFGLSQLYQLRGRVGRTERQAFAYFTYKRDKMINETAKKRLVAIRDFTELGSGFKIAMRDMEIRGAGNILGREQHGHIAAVGFDLYCRLVQEELNKALGQEPLEEESTIQIELPLDAYLPDNYVEDTGLKFEVYKRIAAAGSLEEVDELRGELLDRYGKLPLPATNLLLLGRIKVLAKKARLAALSLKNERVQLRFAPNHKLTGEVLLVIGNKWGRKISFLDKKDFSIFIEASNMEMPGILDLLERFFHDLIALLSGCAAGE